MPSNDLMETTLTAAARAPLAGRPGVEERVGERAEAAELFDHGPADGLFLDVFTVLAGLGLVFAALVAGLWCVRCVR